MCGTNLASIFIAGIILAGPSFGQATQSSAGQLDVTLQGYALAQQGQTSYITSPAFQFSEYLPGLGLLSGRLEGLSQDGGVVAGDSYLQFRGFTAYDLRWNVQGGDFRVPSGMVDNIFQNVYYPEISARGFKVAADRPGWNFTLFGGFETLSEGPRVQFRAQVLQSVLGASTQRKTDGRWQIGIRLLHLGTDPAKMGQYPNLFPVNRLVQSSTALTAQSVYSWTNGLKIFGEGSLAASRSVMPEGKSAPLSGLAGIAFENSTWTAKVNHTYQSTTYLPLLGYFAGDRQGPFAELRFRPRKWIDIFASSGSYRNNLEQAPRVPVFRSSTTSAGGVLLLPWKLSLTAQSTDIRFTASGSQTTTPTLATNRQWAASLARPLKHQTLRVGVSGSDPGLV